jgi:stringent starvation protein B
MDRKEQEKKERLLSALDRGMVMIHLDARRPGVLVPKPLQQEMHLRLNLSYKFDPPDLTVSEWGLRSTLSFSGSRFKVAVPWSALFALTSHATSENWLYPDDMPPELIEQAIAHAKTPAPSPVPDECATKEQKPSAVLREIAGEKREDEGDDEPPTPRARGHLRVIK